MDRRMVVTLFGGLGLVIPSGCDKTSEDASAVPGDADTTDHGTGEHQCGNHADGACGADTKEPADAPAARDFQVEPGEFAELNMKMAAGSTVTAKFAGATQDLSWNVHSHSHDGGTKIHDQGTATEGEVSFTAPEDGVFSVLWKNDGGDATPLSVETTLSEGAVIHSWMPD